MKKLMLLTLLAIACLTTLSFAEEGQVVVVKKECYRGSSPDNVACKVLLKNVGTTDVKNILLSIKTPSNDNNLLCCDSIEYLPSGDTFEYVGATTCCADYIIKSGIRIYSGIDFKITYKSISTLYSPE